MARKNSVVTEFGVFAIALPLIIGFLLVAILSFAPHPGPPVMGVSRPVFIAAPVLTACAVSLVFGVVLLMTRKAWAVVGCIGGGGLIALSYLGVFAILTGTIPINLMTAAMVAVPVLLLARSSKAIAEIREVSRPPATRPPWLPR